MKHYSRVWKRYVELSFAGYAAFRANFLMSMVVQFLWVFLYLQLVRILFANTTSVAGLNKGEVFLIFGLFELVDGIMSMLIWSNVEQFPRQVQLGMVDFLLTKPIDAQFQAAFSHFRLTDVSSFAAGLMITAYALMQGGIATTLSGLAAGIILLVCGMVLYYAIAMLAVTLSFWFIRLDNITMLLTMSYVTARYPLNIFEGFLRKLVFFVIPIGFFVTVPALVMFGKLPIIPSILTGVGLAALFLLVSRLFWHKSIRVYSSASS